jgi:hypothetical protein
VIAQFTLLSSELPIKVETDSLRNMLVVLLINVPNVRPSGCEKVLFSEVWEALAKGSTTPVGYTGVLAG